MKAPRYACVAAWIIIGLGIALRLRQYLANRSLWHDEALLALNIINKNFGGLLGKLDFSQAAPPGFLLLEKLSTIIWGNSELALRLFPLLAGCACLPLLYYLSRCILSSAGRLLALAILSFGWHAIYYSSEAKQFSLDSAIVLMLFLLGTRIYEREPVRCDYWTAAIIGMMAPWFSHPAVFAMAAIWGVLTIQNIKNRRALISILGMGCLWLLSLVVLFLVNLRLLSQNRFLSDFWAPFFMPLSWQAPAWTYYVVKLTLYNPGGLSSFIANENALVFNVLPSIPFILFMIGLLHILRRKLRFGALLGLTLLAALLASALGKYPFGVRMVLFLVPVFAILIGSGIDFIGNSLYKKSWLAHGTVLLAAGFLLCEPIESAARNFIAPYYPEHIRPAIVYLRNELKRGDTIYVYHRALPAFRYYAGSEMEYVAGELAGNNPRGLTAELRKLRGKPRVWLLFSHVYENAEYNEKDLFVSQLEQIGEKRLEFVMLDSEVYLYLYDLRQQAECAKRKTSTEVQGRRGKSCLPIPCIGA